MWNARPEIILPNGTGVLIFPRLYEASAGVAEEGRFSAGRRGRNPSQLALKLREKIAADQANGGVQDPAFYIAWVIEHGPRDYGLDNARTMVDRELAKAGPKAA